MVVMGGERDSMIAMLEGRWKEHDCDGRAGGEHDCFGRERDSMIAICRYGPLDLSRLLGYDEAADQLRHHHTIRLNIAAKGSADAEAELLHVPCS